MDVAAHRFAVQYPKNRAGWSVRVERFKGLELSGVLRTAVLVLLGAVTFVQIVVCANVASMLLARGVSRQGEMAVRAALGAGRWRMIRQLLVESLLLAGAASVMGLGVAWSGLRLMESLMPKYNLIETQSVHGIAIKPSVLSFTLALSLVTGIAVGLLPARFEHRALTLVKPSKSAGALPV